MSEQTGTEKITAQAATTAQAAATTTTESKAIRRVYVVQHGDTTRLVRATSPYNAVMHVYAPTVRIATFEDAKPGIAVEEAK